MCESGISFITYSRHLMKLKKFKKKRTTLKIYRINCLNYNWEKLEIK